MSRRPFAVVLVAAVASLAALVQPAAAISVDCTTKPDDPVGYWLRAVHADQAGVPATAPAIAVLDTGVASVPELQGRLRSGYNVASGDAQTNDIDGHGTAVAAIAAAAGGVRGVSPTSSIIPIKIFDDTGASGAEEFVAGIQRAVAAKASVINVSAAGSPDVDAATKRDLQDAVNAAVSLGIPVIAASGNEGSGTLDLPAALAHVIAVGAIDQSGGHATYSNTGSGLDLVAPGSSIVTAAPPALCSSGYGVAEGTSFAAPIVAGAAALLLQHHPDLDVAQLTDMLRFHTARGSAPAFSPSLGFGLLDVPAVLNAPVPTADQPEVNDDIKWAKLQPVAFAAPKRSKTLWAQLAPHSDPADVYALRLKKGDKLHVTLKQPAGTKIALGFGAKKLSSRKGASFTQKIAKSGTYFVGATLKSAPTAGSGYALLLKR